MLDSKMGEKRNPDIIFQCYQPINVTELREYMLFCISRDMQASLKLRNEQLVEDKKAADVAANANPESQDQQSAAVENITGASEEASPVAAASGKNQKMNIDDLISRLKASVFVPHLLNVRLGTGKVQNLSIRLTRYMQDLEESMARLMRKYNGDVLLMDTIFESGNLLRADRITPSEYRLYMQVDTNTRGHQQWFYFRVRNTRRDRKYIFKLMNFTKPGITGGSGYRKNELFQRIMYKSKVSKHTEWMSIGPEKLEFVKTKVQRRKKDAMAAGADSDQEDWVEEAYGNDANMQNFQ